MKIIGVLVIALIGLPSMAQRCTFGTFGPNAWPDSCWTPYASNSVWNSRIPANPRIWPGSAAVVSRIVSGNTAGIFQMNYPVTGACGHPYFFSFNTDPLATVTCTGSAQPGVSGSTLHVPVVARPNLTCSDHHIAIVDQSTSTEWDFYQFPTGGVNGGNFSVSGCGKINIQTGTGIGTHVTAPYFAEMAGMIRGQEFLQNTINHALFIVTSCDNNTAVYPSATNSTVPCKTSSGALNTAGAPPLGALLWLDYTDAQIAQIAAAPGRAWEGPVLTAIAHYGAYVGDQGGPIVSGPILINIVPEGRETYVEYGATQPYVTVANANGIASNGVFYPFQFSGVDWATHLHVLDPCVPLGYTNQPGGCGSVTIAPPTNVTATVN